MCSWSFVLSSACEIDRTGREQLRRQTYKNRERTNHIVNFFLPILFFSPLFRVIQKKRKKPRRKEERSSPQPNIIIGDTATREALTILLRNQITYITYIHIYIVCVFYVVITTLYLLLQNLTAAQSFFFSHLLILHSFTIISSSTISSEQFSHLIISQLQRQVNVRKRRERVKMQIEFIPSRQS